MCKLLNEVGSNFSGEGSFCALKHGDSQERVGCIRREKKCSSCVIRLNLSQSLIGA